MENNYCPVCYTTLVDKPLFTTFYKACPKCPEESSRAATAHGGDMVAEDDVEYGESDCHYSGVRGILVHKVASPGMQAWCNCGGREVPKRLRTTPPESMWMQIHDEIIITLPEGYAVSVEAMMRETMSKMRCGRWSSKEPNIMSIPREVGALPALGASYGKKVLR